MKKYIPTLFATLAALACVAYLAVSATFQYKQWLEANTALIVLYKDYNAHHDVTKVRGVQLDSLSRIVHAAVDSGIIDSGLKSSVDSLYDTILREVSEANTVNREIKVLADYVHSNEPFWHHVYASLAKR